MSEGAFDRSLDCAVAPRYPLIHVTTMAPSGPGSLREALEAKGPRTIVFDVSGTIVGDDIWLCDICHRTIRLDARGGPHASPGDHDPAYHVAKAYGTKVPGDGE